MLLRWPASTMEARGGIIRPPPWRIPVGFYLQWGGTDEHPPARIRLDRWAFYDRDLRDRDARDLAVCAPGERRSRRQLNLSDAPAQFEHRLKSRTGCDSSQICSQPMQYMPRPCGNISQRSSVRLQLSQVASPTLRMSFDVSTNDGEFMHG